MRFLRAVGSCRRISVGLAADARIIVDREAGKDREHGNKDPPEDRGDDGYRVCRPQGGKETQPDEKIGEKDRRGEDRADEEHLAPSPARKGEGGQEKDERGEGARIDAVDQPGGEHGEKRKVPGHAAGAGRGLRGRGARLPGGKIGKDAGQPRADLLLTDQEGVAGKQGRHLSERAAARRGLPGELLEGGGIEEIPLLHRDADAQLPGQTRDLHGKELLAASTPRRVEIAHGEVCRGVGSGPGRALRG